MSIAQSPTRPGWIRALWAGFLSIFYPGLGHIYAGSWLFGVVLYPIASTGPFALYGMTWNTPPTPAVMAIFFAIAIVSTLFDISAGVDAVLRVRRLRKWPSRPWYRSTWVAAIFMLGIWFACASILYSGFGWRYLHISASSNMPNLYVGDDVTVDSRHRGELPDYGDVVAFRNPMSPRQDNVKRVIGLPGDHVQMRGGIVYLNDHEVPRVATGERVPSGVVNSRIYRETMPNGHAYDIMEVSDDPVARDTEEFIIPARHLFVLGDNRDNSLDSRMPRDVGFVPQQNVYGRVMTIFWSSNLSRIFSRVE